MTGDTHTHHTRAPARRPEPRGATSTRSPGALPAAPSGSSPRERVVPDYSAGSNSHCSVPE